MTTSSTGTASGTLDRFGRTVENAALIALLLSLIGLACTQILLRNVFSMGFPWIDELVRIILLWLAMVGAVAATRDHKQIAIDLLSRFLADHWLRWVDLFTGLFAAMVTGALCFHSVRFVQQSYEFEDLLLGDWPAWMFQIILPIAFGIMFYRYAVMTVGALLGHRNQ